MKSQGKRGKSKGGKEPKAKGEEPGIIEEAGWEWGRGKWQRGWGGGTRGDGETKKPYRKKRKRKAGLRRENTCSSDKNDGGKKGEVYIFYWQCPANLYTVIFYFLRGILITMNQLMITFGILVSIIG